MWVSLSMKSGNRKVGEIPVSVTEMSSCPKECPLKDTDCYARFSYLGIHWRKVKEGLRGDNWTAFCKRVRTFATGQLFRHNAAGDLPQRKDGKIHRSKLRQLISAAKHTRCWTYTHYDPTDQHNQDCIREANASSGMTVNLSADSLSKADEYSALQIGPVVVTLSADTPHMGNKTPGGLPIVICPAQRTDISCEKCKLCLVKERKSIVGFLAHGTASKRLSAKLNGVDNAE